MNKHSMIKCSCGTIIAQCKCPTAAKSLTVIERGCETCHNSTANVEYLPETNFWRIQNGNNAIYLTFADWEYVNSIIHSHYHGED